MVASEVRYIASFHRIYCGSSKTARWSSASEALRNIVSAEAVRVQRRSDRQGRAAGAFHGGGRRRAGAHRVHRPTTAAPCRGGNCAAGSAPPATRRPTGLRRRGRDLCALSEVFNRNSIDGNGLRLDSTVTIAPATTMPSGTDDRWSMATATRPCRKPAPLQSASLSPWILSVTNWPTA